MHRCLFALLACVLALPASRARGEDTETAEATALADQAFKDYDAKRYRQAAQGFLRAYELSGAKFPKQLRNAAKALYTGGFLEDSLETWLRFEKAPGTDADMRADARAQVSKIRGEISAQAQQQAEAARRGKQHAQAGDQFARAYEVSGGMRTDMLLAAAESYEAGSRLDDAHLAWTMASVALAAQPDAQRTALTGADRLFVRLRKLQGADKGYAEWSEKHWEAAAKELLRNYDTNRERGHLRHAAMALDLAGKLGEAESAWTRYETAAQGSRLALGESQRRLTLIRSGRLETEARAAAEAGKFGEAGDKWLAIYELSKGRQIEALRECALAFEQAGDAERAKTWWKKLADTETAPENWRKEAQDHLDGKATAKAPDKKAAEPAKPAPSDAKVEPKIPAVTQPAPDKSCGWCLPAIGGGAGLAVVGGVLIGMAHAAQAELERKLADKDANGKVQSVSYQGATSEQQANVSRNNLGAGLAATGLTVAAASAAYLILFGEDKPVRSGAATAVVLPLAGGGAQALWQLRF